MGIDEGDSAGKQEGGLKAKINDLPYEVMEHIVNPLAPFMNPFLEINLAPYYLAQYKGVLRDVIGDEQALEARYVDGYKSEKAQKIARLGVAAGVTGVITQAILYIAACGFGYPGVLFIPATTNLCSVIDEADSGDKDHSIDSKLE